MSIGNDQNHPIPQGKYVPATRSGALIYTAGMTPRDNGVLIQQGKVRTEEPLSTYKKAVEQAMANALNAASSMLREDEAFEQILLVTVYVNAEETFGAHARLADFASEYAYEQLGDVGIGSRAAIGVASLPEQAPVEIQLVVEVGSL